MCLVVDVIERTVKIAKKEHGNPDYLDLQSLTGNSNCQNLFFFFFCCQGVLVLVHSIF